MATPMKNKKRFDKNVSDVDFITEKATGTKIRKSTREMFEDMTSDERNLFESSIAKNLSYWKEEVLGRFRDGILLQIESGTPANSKDVRSAMTGFRNSVAHYSHYVILDREWKNLMQGKSGK